MHSHTRNHQPCHPCLTPIHLHPVQGLPRRYLQSGGTGASAAVAWDAASETAYIVFEGTDTEADWVQDLLVSQSSDFRPTGADVFDGVGVHQGFLNQFESLTDAAPSAEENITAVVLDLSGGLIPRRVVAAGEERFLFFWGWGVPNRRSKKGQSCVAVPCFGPLPGPLQSQAALQGRGRNRQGRGHASNSLSLDHHALD